jgi:hypothetical protein
LKSKNSFSASAKSGLFWKLLRFCAVVRFSHNEAVVGGSKGGAKT